MLFNMLCVGAALGIATLALGYGNVTAWDAVIASGFGMILAEWVKHKSSD